MVRIRKKTSNRGSTNQRARVKKKVKESRKKAKREAKKNPQQKSKKQKDPGIPNNFPFKDQILAEVAQARRQAEEEKQRRKEEKKKQAATTRAKDDVEAEVAGVSALAAPAVNAPTAAMQIDDVPVLIDTTVPNLKAAIDTADVVVHVLDARDPLSFRSAFVERESKSKKQVFVLNKIDLVPKEALERWATILRGEHPTFFFRSASSFITSGPLLGAANQTKVKAKISTDDAVGIEPLLDYLHSLSNPTEPVLTIALVGVTNSGKSALLNSLLRKIAVQVYNPIPSPSSVQKRPSVIDAPSTTPHPQCLTLTYRKLTFKLIDTPGLSFIPAAPVPALPSSSTSAAEDEDEELRRQTRLAHDILLRNRGNISKLNNPLPAASYIFHRAALADLLVLYNLPAVPEGDLEAFLGSLARREGALYKRGAVVDLVGASRALVRDWKNGRMARYTLPPSLGKNEEGGEGEGDREEKVDEKLRVIYAKDEKVLAAAGVLPRKEIRRIRGGLVQLSCGKVDERAVDLEATVGVESDSDEETEVGFEPKVKGGILKASKGKKKKPEPESDEAGDGESGEDTEEDEEGASGSEEEETMDVDEEMEALPVLSAKPSGKRKRDARKGDKDEQGPAKKVTFESPTKAASKSRPTAPAPKKGAAKGNKVGNAGSGKARGAASLETDKYDFSRYF